MIILAAGRSGHTAADPAADQHARPDRVPDGSRPAQRADPPSPVGSGGSIPDDLKRMANGGRNSPLQ